MAGASLHKSQVNNAEYTSPTILYVMAQPLNYIQKGFQAFLTRGGLYESYDMHRNELPQIFLCM